jgi:hypothetical protein
LRVQVLFVAFPGEGHVRALLPLAVAATQAGHQVVFATGAEGVPVAESSGLATMTVGMSVAEWRRESARRFGGQTGAGAAGHAISGGREGWRSAIRAFALVYAPTMVDDILEVIGGRTPDLVVYDPVAFAGAVVGRLRLVPCAIQGYGVLRPVEALDA